MSILTFLTATLSGMRGQALVRARRTGQDSPVPAGAARTVP